MCSSDPADTRLQGEAALAQAALSKEQLDWAKEIYAQNAPDRAAALTRSNEISDANLEAMKKQTALTDDYSAYNKNTFRPMEQSIVSDAQAYDTPERRMAEAGKARAGMQTALSSTQGQIQRAIGRTGQSITGGKSLSMMNEAGIKGAAAMSGASNQAMQNVEMQGYARKMDAANLGRNLASNQATSAGIALNQGNSATANSLNALAAANNGVGAMQQGFSGASSSMGSAGSLYGDIANQQTAANSASTASTNAGVGAAASLGGAYMMAAAI